MTEVKCPICGEISKSVAAYLAHMAKQHPDVQVGAGRR